jgi:hypothetical protein
MPTMPIPNLLTDPGFLFSAPLGTALPTHTVAGSKFTDAWAAAWVPCGATEEGSTFSYSTTVEPIRVAELFDPVKYATTDRAGSMAFSLASWTLTNWQLAMNGGTFALVSGTGATQLNRYTPAAPGNEVRRMLGWESLDGTVRIVAYQTINGGEVASAFRRAPDKALIPFTFNFEVNTTGVPYDIWTAGLARA